MRTDRSRRTRIGTRQADRWALALLAAAIGLGNASPAPAAPGQSPSGVHDRSRARSSKTDDWTYRPTVLVRRGGAQGSGTVIASVEGEALVLTASHVVAEPGPIAVEFRRYNFGLERARRGVGEWPRRVPAQVAAIDRAADLAVLRIEDLDALPYVARLSPSRSRHGPALDSMVVSIGIDLGRHLTGWSSPLVEALWFELNDNREERLFLITARPPENGRSGGGLFLPNGELVGVCIGHAELIRGRRQGVFASRESILQLLNASDLTRVLARSERLRSRAHAANRSR